MKKFGHAPDEVQVLPGLNPIVASTMIEAEEELDKLRTIIDAYRGERNFGDYFGLC
ncbi:MAG: hypothetical protein ACKVIK_04500 [Rhodospirillales bacterium]|jgi:alkanesulfonate monooxygenase SsuD/methylene tetrahydromethanopterin reductase-like flavin-dependent oxidoreductase (luciferase family)